MIINYHFAKKNIEKKRVHIKTELQRNRFSEKWSKWEKFESKVNQTQFKSKLIDKNSILLKKNTDRNRAKNVGSK